MPGIYQIGVPNAALATGASSVVIQFKGVEDCVFTPLRIELYTELDVNAVKIGGTTQTGRDLGNALPAAAPGSNGGLPTTNGTKLNQAVDLTEGQTIACSDKTGFSLTPAYDAAKTAAQAGDAMSLVTGAITSSKIAAGALSGKGDWSTIAPDNASTAAILAVVQCDKVAILVDGVYWISYRVAGTATEIMRKQMLDANGEPVASITTPVAALRGAD